MYSIESCGKWVNTTLHNDDNLFAQPLDGNKQIISSKEMPCSDKREREFDELIYSRFKKKKKKKHKKPLGEHSSISFHSGDIANFETNIPKEEAVKKRKKKSSMLSGYYVDSQNSLHISSDPKNAGNQIVTILTNNHGKDDQIGNKAQNKCLHPTAENVAGCTEGTRDKRKHKNLLRNSLHFSPLSDGITNATIKSDKKLSGAKQTPIDTKIVKFNSSNVVNSLVYSNSNNLEIKYAKKMKKRHKSSERSTFSTVSQNISSVNLFDEREMTPPLKTASKDRNNLCADNSVFAEINSKHNYQLANKTVTEKVYSHYSGESDINSSKHDTPSGKKKKKHHSSRRLSDSGDDSDHETKKAILTHVSMQPLANSSELNIPMKNTCEKKKHHKLFSVDGTCINPIIDDELKTKETVVSPKNIDKSINNESFKEQLCKGSKRNRTFERDCSAQCATNFDANSAELNIPVKINNKRKKKKRDKSSYYFDDTIVGLISDNAHDDLKDAAVINKNIRRNANDDYFAEQVGEGLNNSDGLMQNVTIQHVTDFDANTEELDTTVKKSSKKNKKKHTHFFVDVTNINSIADDAPETEQIFAIQKNAKADTNDDQFSEQFCAVLNREEHEKDVLIKREPIFDNISAEVNISEKYVRKKNKKRRNESVPIDDNNISLITQNENDRRCVEQFSRRQTHEKNASSAHASDFNTKSDNLNIIAKDIIKKNKRAHKKSFSINESNISLISDEKHKIDQLVLPGKITEENVSVENFTEQFFEISNRDESYKKGISIQHVPVFNADSCELNAVKKHKKKSRKSSFPIGDSSISLTIDNEKHAHFQNQFSNSLNGRETRENNASTESLIKKKNSLVFDSQALSPEKMQNKGKKKNLKSINADVESLHNPLETDKISEEKHVLQYGISPILKDVDSKIIIDLSNHSMSKNERTCNPEENSISECTVNDSYNGMDSLDNQINFDESTFTPQPLDFEIAPLHRKETVHFLSDKEKQEFESNGIKIKTGKFTKKEELVLKKNYEEFSKEYGIFNPIALFGIGKEIKNKNVQNFIRATHFFVRLGKGLNDRTLHSIYSRARIIFNPLRNEGKCNKDDIAAVIRLHRFRGNKWNKIANTVQKTPAKCRDAFNWHEKDVVKGTWTREEEELLINAVQTVAGTTDISSENISNISWDSVAALVPTKNYSQCYVHWGHHLAWSSESGERKKWNKECQAKLINILNNDWLIEDETLVDWKEVYKSFKDCAPSYIFVRKKWYYLKTKIPKSSEMNFREMIQFLCDKYLQKVAVVS